jgi:hypothetical protein
MRLDRVVQEEILQREVLKSVVAAGHAMQQDGRCGVRGLESDDTEEEQARRHDQ